MSAKQGRARMTVILIFLVLVVYSGPVQLKHGETRERPHSEYKAVLARISAPSSGSPQADAAGTW